MVTTSNNAAAGEGKRDASYLTVTVHRSLPVSLHRVTLTQDLFLDLAHRVARQLVDKVHALGDLEARDLGF